MKKFNNCEICDENDWHTVYKGAIRNGSFGDTLNDCVIARCNNCGAERLSEEDCIKAEQYQNDNYRDLLNQGQSLNKHFQLQDELVFFNLEALYPISLRNMVVADIGAGGGAFLDQIQNICQEVIAVEPSENFSKSLIARGYKHFSSNEAALLDCKETVDFAFSIQVIEHVDNPKEFLREIFSLLKTGGQALISTPNRNDILMDFLEDDFKSFFYRSQHRWNFDMDSLSFCAIEAGFKVKEKKFLHRYGLSNTLNWLKDKMPKGRENISPIDSHMDSLWKAWLESKGKSDNLYILLEKD